LEDNKDIAFLDEHDPKKILARTSSGTLKLSEDERGLKFDATLPDTSTARDLAENIQHGNVRGVSFGFNEPEDRWDMDGDIPVRTLLNVPIGEVSATAFPAYPATDISLRSAQFESAIQRLEAGEKDVRSYDGMRSESSAEMRMAYCRSVARNMHESAHDTHEHLIRSGHEPNEHEKRVAGHLHEELRRAEKRMSELRSHLRAEYMSDDPDNDGDEHNEAAKELPDNPPPDHDRDRSIAKIEKQIRTNTILGLPTTDLRMTLSSLLIPPAVEVRGDESVHGPTLSRARKAIEEGKIDGGEWEAPNQGDRKQEDCLGSGLSYPVFKGDKLSLAALRNAASRGAQNAPAVGKAASGLLDLYNQKKEKKAAA
jgi:HK97 family phage prohead protease